MNARLKCPEYQAARHISEPLTRIIWCVKAHGHSGEHKFTRDEQIVSDREITDGAQPE